MGLTDFSDYRHIVRAMLESIGYQSREVLDAMTQDSGISMTEMAVDGGLSVNSAFLRLQGFVSFLCTCLKQTQVLYPNS